MRVIPAINQIVISSSRRLFSRGAAVTPSQFLISAFATNGLSTKR